MYILIEVIERECSILGTYNKATAAYDAMEHYFKQETGLTDKDIEECNGEGDDWGIYGTSAWFNSYGDTNYDWYVKKI